MLSLVRLQAAAKAKKVADKEKKAREGLKKLEVSTFWMSRPVTVLAVVQFA